MLSQMRTEFHCLEGEDQKTDVYKNRARIPLFRRRRRERKPMGIKIGLEFHPFEGEDQKTDMYKNMTRIPGFGRITSEFQCI